jgi:hypothetical protein
LLPISRQRILKVSPKIRKILCSQIKL